MAEAEPESLIVAAQKGAEAVAATLLTPEEEKQAAIAAARQQAEEEARRREAAEQRGPRVSSSQALSLAAQADQLQMQLLAAFGSTGESGPLTPTRQEGPHGDVAVDSASGTSPGKTRAEETEETEAPLVRTPQVEVLAADPAHLETQPQWHDLAVRDLGKTEQAQLLARLKSKLPHRK